MQKFVVVPLSLHDSPPPRPPLSLLALSSYSTGQVFQRFTSDVSDRPTSVGCANRARVASRSSGISSSGDGGGCFPASFFGRTFGEIGRQAVWPRVRSHNKRPGDRRRRDLARKQELLSCDRLHTRKCTSCRTIPPPPTPRQSTSPPPSLPVFPVTQACRNKKHRGGTCHTPGGRKLRPLNESHAYSTV